LRSLAAQLYALLNNAADLTAAIGKSYTTKMSEVWNLPNDVTYPLLAVALSTDLGNMPDGPSLENDDVTVRLWFVSSDDSSPLEAIKFRDALKAKLHLQHVALAQGGMLYSQRITLQRSMVDLVKEVAKYQAYCEFHIVG
jgi:hypothetical protein